MIFMIFYLQICAMKTEKSFIVCADFLLRTKNLLLIAPFHVLSVISDIFITNEK